MPTYRYEGLTPTGEAVQGTVQAVSEDEVRSAVRARGVFISRLTKVADGEHDPDALARHDEAVAGGAPAGEGHVPGSQDWRGTFEPQARRTKNRHGCLGCLGFLLVGGLFFWLLLRHSERVPWFASLAIVGLAMLAVRQLLPAPWPDCPACGRGFRTLGPHCPNCGGPLDPTAPGKRAFCPACDNEIRVPYWAKSPLWRTHLHAGKSGYKRVPVRFCTHCRAHLAD